MSGAAIRRLPRQTLSGQLAERIRSEILDGTFPLGAQLHEAELAETYGVSRGPLREAIQRLIQEGLLRSEPHRGVFVPELTDADLTDIYFVRRALEIAALGRVMAGPDSADLARRLGAITDLMAAALAAENDRGFAELDLDYHQAIVEAADSPRLSKTYATIQAETRLCLHLIMGGYRGSAALVEEHRMLAGLIAGGDAEAAIDELGRHFGDPVGNLKKAKAKRRPDGEPKS